MTTLKILSAIQLYNWRATMTKPKPHKNGFLQVFITSAILVLATISTAAHASMIGFDYNTISQLSGTSELNGIGQTFIAQDTSLADASILLTSNNNDPISTLISTWNDAHFEVRSGTPGSLLGNDSNILFRSSTINFSALPYRGTTFLPGISLYELSLRQWGFTNPISLNPGQLYSLVLVNYGSPGRINYALVNDYSSTDRRVGVVGHNLTYPDNYWPDGSPTNLAFRVQSVPTPPALVLLGLGLTISISMRWFKMHKSLTSKST